MDLKTAVSALRVFTGRPLPHPVYLIFFVTSKCVGKCKHCFYWESINQPETPLTVAEVEKIAASMGRLLQVTFTGGEPFLREDFPDLVEVFHRKNHLYHIGVATSGFHPERVEQGVRKIIASCPNSRLTVGVPIEGPAELNDEIRGVKGFFDRTAETIERLKRVKAAHPSLTILVDITASAFNRGHLRETYELVRERFGPDNQNVIITRGVPREEGARDLDPGEVDELFQLMERDIRQGAMAGYSFFGKLLHAKDVLLRRMALDIYRHDTYHLPCQAGRVVGVIMPEGLVHPCELWEESIGSLRDNGYDFPALWNSPPAAKIRREIISSCCTCYHQCFLSNNIFWNLRSWPAILREYARIRAHR